MLEDTNSLDEAHMLQESKRSFLHSVVNEGGDKEKLESFVNFCEDTIFEVYYISAATWQNQQNECVASEDSDQSGHPPSLIRVFAVCSMGS